MQSAINIIVPLALVGIGCLIGWLIGSAGERRDKKLQRENAIWKVILDGTLNDEPVWGYKICKATSLSSGTVYIILDKLLREDRIRYFDEKTPAKDRPARRFYTAVEPLDES